MSNFFFCHYVFKKPSAAEASESVYMRERVNIMGKELIPYIDSHLKQKRRQILINMEYLLGP